MNPELRAILCSYVEAIDSDVDDHEAHVAAEVGLETSRLAPTLEQLIRDGYLGRTAIHRDQQGNVTDPGELYVLDAGRQECG
jgi:hypothetical protein